MTAPTEYVSCNLCGNRSVIVRYSNVTRIDTKGTQVVECDRCGLVYLNPRLKRLSDNFTMDEAYLLQFYLPYYQKLGLLTDTQDLNREQNYWFHQGALVQMQPYRQTNRVLDVGCAIGLFLAATQTDQWQSFGVEPSHYLGAYGRQKFGLSISEGVLSQLDFPPNYFDLVTLWDVTEHLLDPVATYQLVNRVLRPGGLLLLRMPNWQSLARETLGPAWDMFVTDHFYYFTPVTLSSLLHRTGFVPKYISAEDLVDSEVEAIKTKLGPHVAEDTLRRFRNLANSGSGSTLTAAAEKTLSQTERWQKAVHLVRSGAWRTLAQETLSYGRWKLKNPR